jgi:hypothetical protein
MKPAFIFKLVVVASALLAPAASLEAQFTAISYQGQLRNNAQVAEGIHDFRFALFSDVASGTQIGNAITNYNVSTVEGLFTTSIDFGPNVFTGAPVWLAIAVRPAGTGAAFEMLSPRQPLYPVPEAVHAGSASSVTANSVTSSSLAVNSVTASKIASGSAVTSINGRKDNVIIQGNGGITVSASGNVITVSGSAGGGNAWNLSGNSGTTAGQFVGTTDNRPLELRVNNGPALRLTPGSGPGLVNVIGGSSANQGNAGADGYVIGGGGSPAAPNVVTAGFATVAGGSGNQVHSPSGTISGGAVNSIGSNAAGGFVGGGTSNVIGNGAISAVIVGGELNRIEASATHATIAGGYNNQIGSNSRNASLFGGSDNLIGANAQFSFSMGGFNNKVGDNALYGAVVGGSNNRAFAPHTFAAGRNAVALNGGSFVWADSKNGDFPSTAVDQFSVRATGGVRFVSAIDGTADPTAGVSLAPGATAWSVISDRAAKKNFQAVDTRGILEQLVSLPVLSWNYTWEPDSDTPNLGPVAQDFKSAFFPNRDDRTITTLEFDGVTFAAIHGLNKKLQEEIVTRDEQLAELRTANEALSRRLEVLEERVR